MSKYKFLGPFNEIVTMWGLPKRGPLWDEQLEVVKQGGIILKDEEIFMVGKHGKLRGLAKELKAEEHDVFHRTVCLPGFIDCHTHICFSGSRAADYALRNAGVSYLDIAKKGGGIRDTMRKTREATLDDLVAGIEDRAGEHLREGVTTIEVKSGYGLNLETELRMLEAIHSAKTIPELIPTCLAAHLIPPAFENRAEEYLSHILHDILPVVKERNLASRVDIFIEKSAFTVDQGIKYLQKAKKQGFEVTVHADQFTVGGSEVAAKTGAISADHLEASGQKEIERLAKNDVIPVALPGASMGLGEPFSPGRKLLDAGCSLAVASDWNPGSAPMGDLLIQAFVFAAFEKLSNAEILAAITCRAAGALGKARIGALSAGMQADLTFFPCDTYTEIPYHQGKLKPFEVWKKGEKVRKFSQ